MTEQVDNVKNAEWKASPRRVYGMNIGSLFLLFCYLLGSASSKTLRYRNGVLSSDGGDYFGNGEIMSVAAARKECNKNSKCVSFSFSSPIRFPEDDVKVFFFEHADWHVADVDTVATNGELEPSFVAIPTWHTYINSTRELNLVVPEVNRILSKIMTKLTQKEEETPSSKKTIRGTAGAISSSSPPTSSVDQITQLFSAFFDILTPKAHKAIALPVLAPHAIRIAGDSAQHNNIRIAAMQLLIVLGDAPETGPELVHLGSYQTMMSIISQHRNDSNKKSKEWDKLSETALDVIANICFFRSANDQLRELGAIEFLQTLVSEPGFPGLQAAMALMHLLGGGNDDEPITEVSLPKETIKELMVVLQSAIDEDIAHGIKWDLVPGPLTSINYFLQNKGDPDELLNEGLMEQLLRVLEDSLNSNSEDLFVTLEILLSLSQSSKRAKLMIMQADHTLRDVNDRLVAFQKSLDLATRLSASLTAHLDSSSPRYYEL